MAIRFKEGDARPMGRATAGVRGLRLKEGDEVVGMVVTRPDSTLLVVSENGLGKRTAVDAYRLQNRGGSGVINLKTSKKTGEVVAIRAVSEGEQLMMMTKNGVVNRQRVSEISVIGRNTQGVKLMNLDKGDVVVDVARVILDHENVDELDGAEGVEDGADAQVADTPVDEVETEATTGDGSEES
jgi:DNA gyrase subunit A